MCFYSYFRTQLGIEPVHPSTLYPEDVFCYTIGHVGSTIYVVNEVLFIYHSLLTLHIYTIYKIYNMHITIYITYEIYNTYIRCMLFFFFSGPNQVLTQGILVPGIQKMSSITPSVTWVPQYMLLLKSYLYTTHF